MGLKSMDSSLKTDPKETREANAPLAIDKNSAKDGYISASAYLRITRGAAM